MRRTTEAYTWAFRTCNAAPEAEFAGIDDTAFLRYPLTSAADAGVGNLRYRSGEPLCHPKKTKCETS
jgi:hypothetical protein